MYARTVGDRELTFGVSGLLWRDNLVMYDRQTDSWWAQASGKAIKGPLAGTNLTMLSADMMTWAQWRRLHPETDVLSKQGASGVEGTRDRYQGYHTGRGVGVTGRTTSAGALAAKAKVIGFQIAARASAVPLEAFENDPLVQAEVEGQRAILVATPDRTTARVFLAGPHAFTVVGVENGRTMLRDRGTSSQWDGYEGLAVSGSLAGHRLEPVPAYVSYWFSWRSFFPDTHVVQP